MDMNNPLVLYAAMWEHGRKPWKVISGGPGSGLYKSADGGQTWNKIHNGLPNEMGKMAIAVSRSNSDRVYALIETGDGVREPFPWEPPVEPIGRAGGSVPAELPPLPENAWDAELPEAAEDPPYEDAPAAEVEAYGMPAPIPRRGIDDDQTCRQIRWRHDTISRRSACRMRRLRPSWTVTSLRNA